MIALLFLAGVILWRWRRTGEESRSVLSKIQSRTTFHAISIRYYGEDACDAVKRMEDKRILSSQAPMLPLPECDAPFCNCRYEHHDDRRQGERRHPWSVTSGLFGPDRRASSNACRAVKQLWQQRFLAKDAPPLPLPDCDATRCECRYIHFDDRRKYERIESPGFPFGSSLKRTFGKRRFHSVGIRCGRDRRQSHAR